MPAEDPLPISSRILWTLALYACVMSLYFGAGHAARPPFLQVATFLDHAIPFMPAAMAGYALVYVVPVSLLFIATTEGEVRRMVKAVVLAYVIAAPFFLVMPVQDEDPPLVPVTLLERLLVVNRDADVTHNACPSMHVGLAVLLALIGWRRSRVWGVALGASAVVIGVSTLLVKQHFLIDLPAGALVAVVAHRLVYGRGDQGSPA